MGIIAVDCLLIFTQIACFECYWTVNRSIQQQILRLNKRQICIDAGVICIHN